MSFSKLRPLPYLIAMQFVAVNYARAEALPLDLVERTPAGRPAFTMSGASGGMTVPDGRTMADGVFAFGFNNQLEPGYPRASSGRNYVLGIGVLPYIELFGRLVDYPTASGRADSALRDLSANAKLALPRLFDYQPDIAFGVNDIGGGAMKFRSRYVAVSERIGAWNLTAGTARGAASLNGPFGSVEWILGQTGVSLLAERSGGVNSAGLRYASRPIAWLANAGLVLTAQRAAGGSADRSTFGLSVVIPVGPNARAIGPAPSAPFAAPAAHTSSAAARSPAVPALRAGQDKVASAPAEMAAPAAIDISGPLRSLQTALQDAGLERVRVGTSGSKLVIEYENHRYNQNEVDAMGIAFGLGARLGPAAARRIHVVGKKAGLALYETSVDRAGFLAFLDDADPHRVIAGMLSRMRPLDDPSIEWLDRAEGSRGFSRIVLQPVMSSFVGTELGVFDYSLAAGVQGFVPVWKGAEVSALYALQVTETDNFRNGLFAYASQRSGLRSLLLSQSFWLTDRLLNVASVGKFQQDTIGFQNEATYFVPGRDDQVRIEYSRLRYSGPLFSQRQVSAGAFYQLKIPALDMTAEAGYSQYVGNDRGPSLRVSRWFGDVEAQAYVRRADQVTFAGVRLAFPLTLRQGMRPGWTHVQGTNRFTYGLETRLAGEGGDNRIIQGPGMEIPVAYSARNLMLNRGRIGEEYFLTQLPRMREAALLYSQQK